MVAKLLAAALLAACSDSSTLLLVNDYDHSVDFTHPLASFRIEVVRGASAEDVAFVRQAAEAWSAMASQEIVLTVMTDIPMHAAQDGEIVVQFRPTGVSEPDGYYLGYCTWDLSGVQPSLSADAWIADDLGDADKIATVFHELGHAVGLPHSMGQAASIMKTDGSMGENSYVPTCADAAELCRLWGCYPACSAPGF